MSNTKMVVSIWPSHGRSAWWVTRDGVMGVEKEVEGVKHPWASRRHMLTH